MLILVVDTETTGLDPNRDRVVEVGFALTDLERTVDHGSCLVNPGIPIPPAASAIHHLVDVDVEGAPNLEQAVKLVKPSQAEDCMAAHNAPFDASFLPMLHGPWLDTRRMARRYLPDMPEHGNQFLRYALKLDVPASVPAHRALGDCLVTAALLRYLLNGPAAADLAAMPLVDFIALQAEPLVLRTVTFGKHRGQRWSDVPRGYLEWLAKNSQDSDADTIYTVRHYLGR